MAFLRRGFPRRLVVEDTTPDPIPETAIAREFTNGVPEAIFFASLSPAAIGAATYAMQGTAPAGVSMTVDSVDLDGTQADGVTFTVRRTDANGQRDFAFTITKVEFSLTANAGTGVAQVVVGSDTRTDIAISGTITGSEFDGVAYSFTLAQAITGYLVTDPVIGFSDDADSDGLADAGDDLEVARGPLLAYTGSAPTVSYAWRDQSGDLGDTDTDYTAGGDEDVSIFVRASITGQFRDSAAIPVVAPATIVINSIGPQSGDDVPVAYDILPDDPTVEAVLFLSTDPDPDAADFNTGATSGYIDLGTVALTEAGSGINLAVPDGLDDTYKLGLLPTGGGDTDVVVSDAFALVTASLIANQTVTTKAANETRTSTTTFANDGELISDTLEANSTYYIKGHLRISAHATPDFKFTLNRTGLASALLSWILVEDAGFGQIEKTWATSTAASAMAGAGVIRHTAFIGTIRTAAATGTLNVQWAQNTSSVENTTMHAGSVLIIEKAT